VYQCKADWYNYLLEAIRLYLTSKGCIKMSEILGTMFGTLMKLLGVAAVVGVLYMVFASNKTGDAISHTTQLQTNVQSLYSSQASFSSLTNAVAIAAKLAPTNMVAGSTLVNPWGGAVTLAANANNARFDLTTAAIPSDACPKLIQSQASAVALRVGTTSFNTLPLDAGAAVQACATDTNTITFTYAH
jgi:hypothetical protein